MAQMLLANPEVQKVMITGAKKSISWQIVGLILGTIALLITAGVGIWFLMSRQKKSAPSLFSRSYSQTTARSRVGLMKPNWRR